VFEVYTETNNRDLKACTSTADALAQVWANFFVGGPNEKSKMSGRPT
jgi:hypothetical protein